MQTHFQSKEEYVENLMDLILDCKFPLIAFDNKLMQINQEVHMKSFDMTCSSAYVRGLPEEQRKQTASQLHYLPVSVKLDLVSKKGRNVLGISVQFIEDWNVEIRHLAMKELTGPVTAESLKTIISGVLLSYQLESPKIYSVIIDCGWSVVDEAMEEDKDSEGKGQEEEVFQAVSAALETAAQEFSDNYPWSVSHVVHLAVTDFLKGSRNTFLTHTKALVKQTSFEKGTSLPVFPKTSRWTSSYQMIESLRKIKEKLDESTIRTFDWQQLDELHAVLEPVFVLAKKLQEKHFTPGDLMVALLSCKYHLGRLKKLNPLYDGPAQEMIAALNKRTMPITETLQFQAALVFDPRTTLHHFTVPPSQRPQLMDYLESVNERIEIDDSDDMMQNKEKNNQPLRVRLEKLLSQPPADKNLDVLAHWDERSMEDFELSDLAAAALAFPVTQVTAQRAFAFFPLEFTEEPSGPTLEDLYITKWSCHQ